MPLRLISAAGLLATAVFVACLHRGTDSNPFAVSPDSLFNVYNTIAVAPVDMPADLDITEDAVAQLEDAVEEQLQRMGFSVVPSFEYLGAWQHIANEIGGFYDTYTGQRDEDLFNYATERLRSDLNTRFDVDAILYPELWIGTALFFNGLARWDGTAQAVFGARGMNGEVGTLSLVVSIEDMTGRELYSNVFGFATIEAWYHDNWLPLALDAVVGDSRLVSTAVENVFAPMVEVQMSLSSGHLPQ
jgi:hypothetical protein